jgi:hypothetical protein
MPNLISIRWLAVLITLGLRLSLSGYHFDQIFAGASYAHYFLYFWFTRNRVSVFAKNNGGWIAPAAVLAGTMLFFSIHTYNVSLLLFGTHTVLNDAYIFDRDRKTGTDGSDLFALRLLGNAGVYLVMLWKNFESSPIFHALSVIGSVVGIFLFLFYVTRFLRAEKVDRTRLKSVAYYELALVPLFFYAMSRGSLDFDDIVFYHLSFWFMGPFLAMFSNNKELAKPNRIIILQQTIFISALGCLGANPLVLGVLDRSIPFFGYIHVCSSFFISRSNPAWLISLLKMRAVGGQSSTNLAHSMRRVGES